MESPLSKANDISEQRIAALTLRLQEMETASDRFKKKENDLLSSLHERDRQSAADKELVTQWVTKYDALKSAHDDMIGSAAASSNEGASQIERECDAREEEIAREREREREREAAMLMELGLLKEELKAAALSKVLQGQQFEEALTAQKVNQSKEEAEGLVAVARIIDLEKAVRDGLAAVERYCDVV